MDDFQIFDFEVPCLPRRILAQSITGYTRRNIELIESLIADGIKKPGLVVAFRNAGFEGFTPRALENALYRARCDPRPQLTPAPLASEVPAPAQQAPPRIEQPASPAISADQLRKPSGFQYKGTVNLDVRKLV
jgi:hypothetical protein